MGRLGLRRIGGLCRRRHERIVQVKRAVIVGNSGIGQVAAADSPRHSGIGCFLLDLRLAGQRGQVAGPVIGGAQQPAQAAEIGHLLRAHNGHKEKAQRDRREYPKQNRDSHKFIVGQPQRPCTDSGQDAHDERRDAEAAREGPADRRQHNADSLAAVFPFALQTALPCGEAVGLRPAHGIARLCKGVCNAAQHRRADFAARLNGAVQHIAEVVVIVLIFGSSVVRHLVVQSVVTAL